MILAMLPLGWSGPSLLNLLILNPKLVRSSDVRTSHTSEALDALFRAQTVTVNCACH